MKLTSSIPVKNNGEISESLSTARRETENSRGWSEAEAAFTANPALCLKLIILPSLLPTCSSVANGLCNRMGNGQDFSPPFNALHFETCVV
nr:hypothetical protein Iba_chr13aCG3800 [Ipomoea batatas]